MNKQITKLSKRLQY